MQSLCLYDVVEDIMWHLYKTTGLTEGGDFLLKICDFVSISN